MDGIGLESVGEFWLTTFFLSFFLFTGKFSLFTLLTPYSPLICAPVSLYKPNPSLPPSQAQAHSIPGGGGNMLGSIPYREGRREGGREGGVGVRTPQEREGGREGGREGVPVHPSNSRQRRRKQGRARREGARERGRLRRTRTILRKEIWEGGREGGRTCTSIQK
jgi:hypothetical protein